MKLLTKLLLPLMLTGVAVQAADDNSALSTNLQSLLQEHELIRVIDNEVDASQQQVSVEHAAWYPKATVSGDYGRESIDRDIGTDSDENPASASLSLRQKIWDFGQIEAAIDKAEKNVDKKQAERSLQEQNLMLAGIEAYLGLKKAYSIVDYATQSEVNIKHQAKLENTRIKSGKGYTADVLQAKAQLSGAQARRVSAEQQLANAFNRYESIFHRQAPAANQLQMVAEPTALLPKSLDEALSVMATSNPDVVRDISNVKIAQAEKELVSAREWMPNLDLVAETRKSRSQDGIQGDRSNNKIAVQFTWAYDFGGKASKAVSVANTQAAAEQAKADYTLQKSKEEAQNSWHDLQLLRQRSNYLKDQVDIAGQFLELARKERELGRRSLIDVLAGETALINAQSDHSAAQSDTIIAAYRILRSMGKMKLSDINSEL